MAPPKSTKAEPESKLTGWRRYDLISRGSGEHSLAGTVTFIGLRLLDLPLQYHLLHSGAAERAVAWLGLTPLARPAAAAQTGFALLDRLDLPPTRLLLLAAAAGPAAKQLFWLLFLNSQEFPPAAAVAVSAYNSTLNSINALLLVAAATSSAFSPGPRVSLFGADVPLAAVVGAALVAVGVVVETLSELQRKAFKADPRNRGRLCTVGLWCYARHINYLGYSLLRGGCTMVATGWIGGLLVGFAQGWDLSHRAVGVLDEYCGEKYGAQWTQFKKDVPYRILPGLY